MTTARITTNTVEELLERIDEMITISITGPQGSGKTSLAEAIRAVARSLPVEYTIDPILVVDDEEPRPFSLNGINLLIETQQTEATTDGPWEIYEPPSGYVQIVGGHDDGYHEVVCEVQDNQHEAGNAELIARGPEMRAALAAVLLFHSGSPWDDEKRRLWRKLVGVSEATTVALCDAVRRALAWPKLTINEQEHELDEKRREAGSL
jgi:hypothetical protein